LAQRVAAGAALLDRAGPGWPAAVDPDRLDMRGEDHDVLAQLYGSYYHGLDALAAVDHLAITRPGAWAAWHGFDLVDGEPSACYAELTRCWQPLVAARQQGRSRARPASPTFAWGRNLEHQVAAEPIQSAAQATAPQALARAAELRHEERGGAR
jgi:hypothetical protein